MAGRAEGRCPASLSVVHGRRLISAVDLDQEVFRRAPLWPAGHLGEGWLCRRPAHRFNWESNLSRFALEQNHLRRQRCRRGDLEEDEG